MLVALPARADAPPEQEPEPPAPRASEAPRPDAIQIGALQVGPFSRSGGALPPGWEPLEFEGIPAHTRYGVERSAEGEPWVVRARSEAAASGLIRRIEINLAEYPIVRWRWRIENLLEASDPTQKSGDDYAARLYIAFRYEPENVGLLRRAAYRAARAVYGDLPFGAITYIWATDTPVDSIVDNAYAGSFVKMIVVESGPERVGAWVEERRNVYEDYRRAFGAEPPRVEGVAIMTDTDDTGERASAAYGDIVFLTAEADRSAEAAIDAALAAEAPTSIMMGSHEGHRRPSLLLQGGDTHELNRIPSPPRPSAKFLHGPIGWPTQPREASIRGPHGLLLSPAPGLGPPLQTWGHSMITRALRW